MLMIYSVEQKDPMVLLGIADCGFVTVEKTNSEFIYLLNLLLFNKTY